MARTTRRKWIGNVSTSAISAAVAGGWISNVAAAKRATKWRIAPFRVDVTPPLGHPLLGGNYRPAEKIGDPLFALGVIVLGNERPIVVMSLDWCELRNEAYARFRQALATAVDTTVDRVLISCVHQHDAPYVDLGAQRILTSAGITRPMCDPAFFQQAVERVSATVKKQLAHALPLTHMARARAPVERIASNRRVLKSDGTPYFGRYSTCRDPKLREQPDGEIDPNLTSLTLYSGNKAIANLCSYAVHPMSPYGGGIVSADFIGDARARRQRDLPDTLQIYFTGCAGDVTAGKYNSGDPDVRGQLADRLYDAMKKAGEASSQERFPVEEIVCRSEAIVLPHWKTASLTPEALQRVIADEKQAFAAKANAALGLSSRQYHADGQRIDLQMLDFGAAQFALFPAESFVSFQLQVQQARPKSFIFSAAFGECAPGYIPTASAIREGFREEHGYCWTDETSERRIVDGMLNLLGKGD